MSTPHIEAEPNEIANIVLMPGDPLRAKFIAETYLEHPVLFNSIRNMLGYTGMYKGKRISVMGSGMGMASIGIYSYELFRFFHVDAIIRIGSAGAYASDLDVYDLVLADSAWSESSFALAQSGCQETIQYPTFALNALIMKQASLSNCKLHVGRVHSSDVFYHEDNVMDHNGFFENKKCICVEMESFALFHHARLLGKQAACLLTISDSLVRNIATSAKERETSFHQMIHVALESAWSLAKP